MGWPKGKSRYENLLGKQFFKLTVIEFCKIDPICRTAIWRCQCTCGNRILARSASLKRGRTKSCGCYHAERMAQLRGKNSPRWKHGKDNNGYPREQGQLKHRLVMETKLGRKLLSSETVHHKNGDRDNFEENNLELWSSRHPKGSRVSDLIEYAKEILRQYAPTLLRHSGAGQ